ncbi:MAG: GNAT family N-acetyltransferase [Bacteroidales bacterium]|nr:GNAT family N-acetyltransferase [Bacteroidales bacterium]
MKPIIPPVDTSLIMSELTRDKLLRRTNRDNNLIYLITYYDSPNTMREIGRLREISFRAAGGGTGNEVDIDEYDTSHPPYKQLIVWNRKYKEIIGGYRFILCREVNKDENGIPKIATAKIFNFSKKFIEEYLPFTIELGRSFIQPNYQSTGKERRGIFALDNLWDGLGSLIVLYKDIKYFFGKVTMYPTFNIYARDLILYFLNKYFSDKENLVTPKYPIEIKTPQEVLRNVFTGTSYIEDYKILVHKLKEVGEFIPPLINSYMNLSPTMKVFGTSVNREFGNVEETAILITIDDIYQVKKERHILNFKLPRFFKNL